MENDQPYGTDDLQSTDPTEAFRRARVADLNTDPAPDHAAAVANARARGGDGQVWDAAELQRDFEVLGFMAPYVIVNRRADGVKGSLEFQHAPRFYFNWHADGSK